MGCNGVHDDEPDRIHSNAATRWQSARRWWVGRIGPEFSRTVRPRDRYMDGDGIHGEVPTPPRSDLAAEWQGACYRGVKGSRTPFVGGALQPGYGRLEQRGHDDARPDAS